MKKILSMTLTMCIIASTVTAYSDEQNSFKVKGNSILYGKDKEVVLQDDEETVEITAYERPDIITENEVVDYVGRIKELEGNLYTFVFRNKDGSNSLRMYSHPVKYCDAEGKVKDIKLDIEKDKYGKISSVQHEVKTTFANKLSDGITLEYKDEVDIKLVPEIEENKSDSEKFSNKQLDIIQTDFNKMKIEPVAVINDNKEAVNYVIGNETSLEYQLTYAGFKEDIVVKSYTGQTEYDFRIYTNGLRLIEIDGSFYLENSNGKVEANIGDIIVFTADERNNTLGSMTYEKVVENQEYVMTIHLDEEYLASEKTIYPIRIDPTIEVNYDNDGAGAIEDVTISSNSASSGTSGSLYIGKRETEGISRVVMRFPGLDMDTLPDYHQITSSSIKMRDLMCESENMTVYSYVFCGNSWSESTVSWSNVNPNGYTQYQSGQAINYANGNSRTPKHYYTFTITKAMKSWIKGTADKDKGILLKASNDVENGSEYIHKTFASYNRTTNKPWISVTYSTSNIVNSLYYSEYDPDKFNNKGSAPAVYSYTDLIQYRMNCYGYALCNILGGSFEVGTYIGYKQQPGEFASLEDKVNVKGNVGSSPELNMQNIVSNMQLDANRMGYQLTEYRPSSSAVEQYGVNSRLIAVVTGISDYHFYMQHNDGTWSHKPGSEAVTNLSLTTGEVLTNDNIISKANQGIYTGGSLKFFITTKPAVIDYPHTNRYDVPIVYLQWKDRAGDYLQTARTVSTESISAKIDFSEDHDVYCFTTIAPRTYVITVTGTDVEKLACKVYDKSGMLLRKDMSSGQIYISIELSSGQKYYFDVYSDAKQVTDYTFSIQ